MRCKRFALECKRGCSDTCACDKSYYPSNGTEGMWFMDKFCSQCIHDNPDPESGKKCELITATMCLYPTEPGYPGEWIYDVNKKAVCTKWVKWDWGNDGDPDDPSNPKKPPDPPDPRQLNLFPLYISDIETIQLQTVKT
jgi:hypothetical protein